MLAGVDDNAVASFGHTGSLGDLAGRQHELAQNRRVAVLSLRRRVLQSSTSVEWKVAEEPGARLSPPSPI